MIEEAYNCLVIMWTYQSFPASWKWKWLVPIPKGASQKIQDVRPITLMEVLCKLWTGLVVQQVTNSLQSTAFYQRISMVTSSPNEAQTRPIFNS